MTNEQLKVLTSVAQKGQEILSSITMTKQVIARLEGPDPLACYVGEDSHVTPPTHLKLEPKVSDEIRYLALTWWKRRLAVLEDDFKKLEAPKDA